MNIAICHLMGLAFGPQFPPREVSWTSEYYNDKNLILQPPNVDIANVVCGLNNCPKVVPAAALQIMNQNEI